MNERAHGCPCYSAGSLPRVVPWERGPGIPRQRAAVCSSPSRARPRASVVAITLGSSDEPAEGGRRLDHRGGAAGGRLPMVVLPSVADVNGDDRLASLEALATKDPTSADVQMAIGSEQLVRGDGRGRDRGLQRGQEAGGARGRHRADRRRLQPEIARRDSVSRPRAARSGRRRSRSTSSASCQLWAGRLPQATAALRVVPRRRAGVVLRRQGRRSAAPRPCSPAIRCSCPPTTRRRAPRWSR